MLIDLIEFGFPYVWKKALIMRSKRDANANRILEKNFLLDRKISGSTGLWTHQILTIQDSWIFIKKRALLRRPLYHSITNFFLYSLFYRFIYSSKNIFMFILIMSIFIHSGLYCFNWFINSFIYRLIHSFLLIFMQSFTDSSLFLYLPIYEILF